MRRALGLQRLLLINDFTALALALTRLPDSSKRLIGGAQAVAAPDAAIGLIGPGTGLGVSGLLPLGYQNKWIPISGEGGHVTLSASTQAEFDVITQLQKRYGHVSGERIISGTGLVDLYHALGDLPGGVAREITTPAQVWERAIAEPNSRANEAIEKTGPTGPPTNARKFGTMPIGPTATRHGGNSQPYRPRRDPIQHGDTPR